MKFFGKYAIDGNISQSAIHSVSNPGTVPGKLHIKLKRPAIISRIILFNVNSTTEGINFTIVKLKDFNHNINNICI